MDLSKMIKGLTGQSTPEPAVKPKPDRVSKVRTKLRPEELKRRKAQRKAQRRKNRGRRS